MILLIAGNSKLILKLVDPDPADYGQLLTPRRTMTKVGLPKGYVYGIDNECFTLGNDFNPFRFLRALWRIAECHGTGLCRFCVAPDVVGDAQKTLDRFGPWAAVIRGIGFPVALVAQDRLENFPVPWDKLDALFIGGTTEWKMSDAAAGLLLKAKKRGKWTHVGRVNSFKRIDQLKVKPDSFDGTHLTKRPDIYARKWRNELGSRKQQLGFNLEVPTWSITKGF